MNGFLAVADGDDVEFRLYETEQANGVPLLCFADDGEVQVVVMGRLYYRDDLAARVRSSPVPEIRDDAGLVLEVYRQLGVTGIESLEGEFALTIFDRRTRRLFAARDPMGGYPLYWFARAQRVIVGTLLQPIEKSCPGTQLDVGYLAELLTLPGAEIDYFDGTPFQDIRRLVSGSTLAVDLARSSVTVHRYWRWEDHVIEPETDCINELGEMYGDALRAAVRERLSGTVGAHLSGGMDSTTVALLAGEAMARDDRQVHALCLVYQRLDRLTEERQYAETAVARSGLIAHRIVADDLLDFDSFDIADTYDEPFTGLLRIGTGIALVDAADAAGCQTILTGFGAEAVLDSAPFYLADLLRRGRLGQTWLEAARWAHAQHSNPWRYIRPFAITPLKPARLAAGVKPLLRRGHALGTNRTRWRYRLGFCPNSHRADGSNSVTGTGGDIASLRRTLLCCRKHLGAFAIRAATGSATTSAPRATFTSRTHLKTRAYSQSAWGRAPVSDRNPTAKSRCWLPRCEMCCHQASLSAPTRCPSMRSITEGSRGISKPSKFWSATPR